MRKTGRIDANDSCDSRSPVIQWKMCYVREGKSTLIYWRTHWDTHSVCYINASRSYVAVIFIYIAIDLDKWRIRVMCNANTDCIFKIELGECQRLGMMMMIRCLTTNNRKLNWMDWKRNEWILVGNLLIFYLFAIGISQFSKSFLLKVM